MLQGGTLRPEDIVVSFLALQGRQEAKQLFLELQKHELSTTMQALYRTLRKLEEDGVIMREKQGFSLSMRWIHSMGHFVEQMEETYFHPSYLKLFLPFEAGEKRTWIFKNILKVNDFWSHVILTLVSISQKRIFLDYSPHLWCELLQVRQYKHFAQCFFSELDSHYSVCINHSFLDKYATQLSEEYKKTERYFLPKNESKNEHNQYINVIDDFIITIQLPNDLVEEIDSFYGKIHHEKDMHFESLIDLFTKTSRIKMIIRKDPNKARVYYKKFEQMFGPLGKRN